MDATASKQTAVVNIPTVIAIGALVMSLNVALHEAVHAVACPLVGGDLQIYTALAVDCVGVTGAAGRFVAGSAPLINLVIGFALYAYLRREARLAGNAWYGVWLFMLASWLSGAGYLLFSGVANVGDMAAVIEGWSPPWLWRGLLLVVGAGAFMWVIALALRVFGTRVGGTRDEQFGRASRMAIFSYVGFILPIALAALFHPAGLNSLPVLAGLAAVLFGQSPLLWMMQWFRAAIFVKLPGEPLVVRSSPSIIVAAVVVVALYAFVLGRGITF
jgi:hypothetical protein